MIRRLFPVASGPGMELAWEAIGQSLLNLPRSGLTYPIASLVDRLPAARLQGQRGRQPSALALVTADVH